MRPEWRFGTVPPANWKQPIGFDLRRMVEATYEQFALQRRHGRIDSGEALEIARDLLEMVLPDGSDQVLGHFIVALNAEITRRLQKID